MTDLQQPGTAALGKPWPACEEQWRCEQSSGCPCLRALGEPGKLSTDRVIPPVCAMVGLVPVLYHRVPRARPILNLWGYPWGPCPQWGGTGDAWVLATDPSAGAAGLMKEEVKPWFLGTERRCPAPRGMDKDGASAPNCRQEERE